MTRTDRSQKTNMSFFAKVKAMFRNSSDQPPIDIDAPPAYESINAQNTTEAKDKAQPQYRKSKIRLLEAERKILIAELVVTEEDKYRLDELRFQEKQAYNEFNRNSSHANLKQLNQCICAVEDKRLLDEQKRLRIRRIDLDIKALQSEGGNKRLP